MPAAVIAQGLCAEIQQSAGWPVDFDGPYVVEPALFALVATGSPFEGAPGGPVFATGRDQTPFVQSGRMVTWRIENDGSLPTSGWPKVVVPFDSTDCRGIAISTDNPDNPTKIFVAGVVKGLASNDILVYAYDAATGNELWNFRYDNAALSANDTPVKIMYDSNFVYVAGNSDGISGGVQTGSDYFLIKLDANSVGTGVIAPNWANHFRYNGPGNGPDVLVDMHLVPAITDSSSQVIIPGYVVLTGTSYGGTSKNDFLTVQIQMDNPGVFSTIRTTMGPTTNDTAVSLAINQGLFNTGSLYVSGYFASQTGSKDDYMTMGYNYAPIVGSSGGLTNAWVNGFGNPSPKTFNGAGNQNDHAVKVVYFGAGVYVTGESWGGVGSGYDIVTLRYDTTGSTAWTEIYDHPTFHGEDRPFDMVVDKNSNIYIGGKSLNGANLDMFAISYRQDLSSGTPIPRWRWLIPGTQTLTFVTSNGTANGFDSANTIRLSNRGGIDHAGEVFLFGPTTSTLTGSTLPRYRIIKYTQTDAACP